MHVFADLGQTLHRAQVSRNTFVQACLRGGITRAVSLRALAGYALGKQDAQVVLAALAELGIMPTTRSRNKTGPQR